MEISGKTALVTGGSAGIGREIARQLKAKGATVIITGRDEGRLAAMKNHGFEVIPAGLSYARDVDNLVMELADIPIDILINNAGQGVDHDFRKDAPDMTIYSNLNAPIRLGAALIPQLKQRPEAAIVNVTSGLAIAPSAVGSVYCATKAGLRSYTQALRAQLADTNIHVIEALPPMVDTQMTAGRDAKKMSAEECARQIIAAIEKDHDEASVGMVKVLKAVHSISPALARKIMLRF